VPTGKLKKIDEAQLKNGEPAVLHEFVALLGDESASGIGKIVKPYIEFASRIPGVVYRNWDSVPGNYEVGDGSRMVDRRAQVLR
jgi:hypothetical protein